MNDTSLRITVEDIALSAQCVQHAKDQRWFADADEGVHSGIGELGRGLPVVGVVRDEKGLREEAGSSELVRCVGRRVTRPIEPTDAFTEPALGPPEEVQAAR